MKIIKNSDSPRCYDCLDSTHKFNTVPRKDLVDFSCNDGKMLNPKLNSPKYLYTVHQTVEEYKKKQGTTEEETKNDQLQKDIKYIRGDQPFKALEFRRDSEKTDSLYAYCDESLANEPDRKSRTGYIIHYEVMRLRWVSKRQGLVTTSTT
ncbi:hypothetical protein CAAN3_08S01882 [[Candida] anglica]